MNHQVIRIFDKCNGVICVTLLDLLNLIPQAEQYYWHILELEAVGDVSYRFKPMLDLQEAISTSESGLQLSWDQLVTLASHLEDTWEATIVGQDRQQACKITKDAPSILEQFPIVIEMLDSWCWQIRSSDHEWIAELEHHFSETQIVEA